MAQEQQIESRKAVTGVVWASIDQFTTMGLQFISNLILARLLLPSDYGAVAMLSIFLVVSNTLIDGGFGNALIQKKNPSQADYSTIFFWNLALSSFLYAILFIFAPLIARFYDLPELCNVLRINGTILILNSFLLIPHNRLRKQFAFKKLAIVNISSYILAAGLAIWMAKSGFGVYALVAMHLAGGSFAAIFLFIVARWVPSLTFSIDSFKKLFSFGGYMLAASLLQDICKNLQNLIIGKHYNSTQLGLYAQAQKLDQIPSYTLPQILVKVMFPFYSSMQDDKAKMGSVLMMNMRIIALWIFPLMSVLIIGSKSIFLFLYGQRWLDAVPYFQILCVGGFFVCLQNVTFYAVAAVGKSRALFAWSWVKWLTLFALLMIGMNLSMKGLLWCMVLSNVNIFFINVYLSGKHVNTGILPLITNLLPTIFCTATAWASTQLIATIASDNDIILCISFLIVYVSTAILFKLKGVKESRTIINKLLHRN